jgi:hypothetical protein
VRLPPLTSAKVKLYQEARARGVTKADFGRLLGWHGPQVDRLFVCAILRNSSRSTEH